ncbi:MAG: dTDP-4-dehydrorhamnose reductase [Spongiibacteraceae bacterium]|jgi:dTDP-4-dehydrorhamnose reductase|nr:dTDP-4-dehydrorhamnose reductase [Spongiibacteraceae bacterium]
MKVMLTGAGGQLGQALRDALSGRVELDARDRTTLDLVDGKSIRDILEQVRPDVVINAAAFTHVDQAEADPQQAALINHLAPGALARQCGVSGARLIHISTDFVFDGRQGSPYTPQCETHPLNIYGETKRLGELAVLEALPGSAAIIRTAWLYSHRGNNFLTKMLGFMRAGRDLRVVTDQVGTPTSVDGLVGLIDQMLFKPPRQSIYHWTDAGVASWYDFACAIQEEALAASLLDAPVDILPIPASAYPIPAVRPAYSVLDKSATYQEYDPPLVHWRTMLRRAMQRIANQESGFA